MNKASRPEGIKMKYTLLINKARTMKAIRDNDTGVIVNENINPIEYARLRKLAIINRNRAQRNECMKDLGLSSYRNASGTVCWE